jgi:CRISPR-associated protein Cas1
LVLPPELGFDAREHHGAADPVNASLNYGYGILYSKVFAKLVRAGLDPYVGFLHAIGDGRASLLYDFVEEFRQYFVDRPVLGWLIKGGRPELKDGLLVRESRAKLASLVLERLNSRVPYGGREIPAEEVIECEARELARDIRGQERHKPYIWPW